MGMIPRERVEPFIAALQAEEMGVDPDDGQWFGVGGYGLQPLFGVARIHERDGFFIVDDVFVMPEQRGNGFSRDLIRIAKHWVAHRRAAQELWLLCDEDMVAFYEGHDFLAVEPSEFPAPLAELSTQKGEWPRARDHVHIAMRAPAI